MESRLKEDSHVSINFKYLINKDLSTQMTSISDLKNRGTVLAHVYPNMKQKSPNRLRRMFGTLLTRGNQNDSIESSKERRRERMQEQYKQMILKEWNKEYTDTLML